MTEMSAISPSANRLRVLVTSLIGCAVALVLPAQTFWVATDGDDSGGTGGPTDPWQTISHAIQNVPDGSLILVESGTYSGRVQLRGQFSLGVMIRSQVPYQARLRHDSTVVTCFYGRGIILEGFDIAHDGPGAGGLVIQIQDLLDPGRVENITIRNNVIHDSYNNDLLKVNNGAGSVLVEGNIFYNQEGSDEHIDVNSVSAVVIRDNLFFNDFDGSDRDNFNDTSSFIVIKDSNGASDGIIGSSEITVRRNIFLNWEGSTGSNFVLVGEDGNPYFEATDVLIENNLMLGNSGNTMRASFGVKGGKDITFRHNTVVGDLPALAFAMRLNTEGSNPANENIGFYNNIWADPTGSMGATSGGGNNDFSDAPAGETVTFEIDNNLYYNGGAVIPEDPVETINYTDDSGRILADPLLADQSGLVLPRWDQISGLFADGSTHIGQAFRRLARLYGSPSAGGSVVDQARDDEAPDDDLLGHPRIGDPDLGAIEWSVIFADSFESGDLSFWIPE